MMEEELVIVLSTIDSEENAERISRTLVEEKLAACVNIIPKLRSIYRWKGKIENDAETLMLIKARASDFKVLQAKLQEIHPYENPEIVQVAASAVSDTYLSWAIEQTERD